MQPYPIEYKRGKPKVDHSDKIQLCAQAICLEEMHGIPYRTAQFFMDVPAAVWMWRLTSLSGRETEEAAYRVHGLIESGKTPKPVYDKRCESCSLMSECMPKSIQKKRSVKQYPGAHGGGDMRKHLNTLFVTSQGAYLAKEGETVVVRVEKEVKLRVPVHTIGGIVCFGNVSCSPFLMGFCAENGVGISFLSEYGRFPRQGPGAGVGKCPA